MPRIADKVRMSLSRRISIVTSRISIILVLVLAVCGVQPAKAQGAFQFSGTTPVSTPAAPQMVTVAITRAGSLDSIKVRTQGNDGFDYANATGGTCSTGMGYSAGQQCTVNVAFTPTAPGERRGAIVLLDSNKQVLGMQLLTATATGPVGTFVPGSINTVAGDTVWIYAGDGGPATQSSIFLPFGVAVDAAGNLYIADASNNRIRKVDGATQLISTIAGNGNTGSTGDGGPASQASLSNPTSIAVDPAGNIYFSDNGNNAIRRISAFDGTISTVAGILGSHGYTGDAGQGAAATLNGPNGINFDSNGNLYIADSANNVVRMLCPNGQIFTVAGTGAAAFTGDGGPATSAALNAPWGVSASPNGVLYIADQGNNRIRTVTGGTIQTILGNGTIGYTGDNGPATAATVNVPSGTAIDVAGNIYVADSGNNVVRKISAKTGIITTVAGDGSESIKGDKGPATAAGLYGPYTLALDNRGNLLVADVFHNRIREVFANQATLDYPAQRVGRISDPLLQNLENDGNAPLNVATMLAVTNSKLDDASTTCTSASPLTEYSQCVVGVDFAPTSVGNPTLGSLNVTSDASNSPGVITLSGQVLNVDPSQVTLASSQNPSVTGATVVFSISVTSVGTTPTGTVTLLDGTNVIATGTLGPNGTVTFNVSTLTAGQHSMTASYAGDNNNAAGVSTVLIQVVKAPVAPTTTTLATSANPVVAGAPLTLTAQVQPTVASSGNGAVTGTVNFKSGSTLLGSASISNGVAVLGVTSLPVGADSIIATYAGSDSYASSSSAPLSETVQIATTKTVVSTGANPSSGGGALTLSASVSGNGGTPTGLVTFFDGTTNLGSGSLSGTGTATLNVQGPQWTVGTHSLTATYAGDPSDTGSTSAPYSETIVFATTKIQLASNLNPAALGAAITFSGTVSSNGGTPTGTLQFFDGPTAIGQGVVNGSGVATVTVSSLILGSHNITATYAGDAMDAGTSSQALVQVVQPANIGAVLAASANPSIFGNVLTLNATVTGNGSAPTGSVTFTDGTTTLGVVALTASGTASYTTSSLTIGSHSLSAAYSGDANHAPVGTNTITESIVQGTSTTLSGSNLNPIAGTSVTWTAAVSGANGQPVTGQIAILDGKSIIATLTPNASGVATMTSSGLTPGQHSLSANYTGDTLDAPSTSVPLTAQVTIATTQALLTSSANPSFTGSPLTLTATVNSNGGLPTGNVAFLDGGNTIGTQPLNSQGVATLTISTLQPGIHKLTARYVGDTLDAPATSPAVSQQIAEKTTVNLVSSQNPSLLTDNVTFTVTVGNGVSGAPPTGQVTLTDGGSTIGTATLDGNGVATFPITAPALGQHNMVATYSGDNQNVPVTSETLVQIVNLRPSTTSLTASPTQLSTGQPLQLISVVQGQGPKLPTGTVTFASGSTVLGSATVDSTGLATVTVQPMQGVYKIVATYSGDSLFASSVSAGTSVTVGPPIEFSLSMAPPTMSLKSGAHATMQISIATASTFNDTIAFGCAGLPASATCTFSNDKVAVNGQGGSLSVIVDTGNPLGVGAASLTHPNLGGSSNGSGILAAMLPAGLLALLFGRKRHAFQRMTWRNGMRPMGLLIALILLTGVATLSGCGSTFNTNDTPAGSYTFQIVGTGQTTGATQAATVKLTVTQ
jgi:sugar lactone lactonase YvrE